MVLDEAYELLPRQVSPDGDISLGPRQAYHDTPNSPDTPGDGHSIVTFTTPLVKRQAAHEVESSNSGPEIYHSHFSRRKQFLELLFDGFLRFLLTIFFIGCIYATLKAFGTRTIIGPVGKRVFNTLVTGLSMILGISIASSFKDLAIDMRWWILSRKRRPISEVDAILSSHSLTQVSKLAASSLRSKKPGIVLSCALWVLFNIAAQAAVAMLGLTYSLNPAVDPTRPVLGATSFSNMSEAYGRVLDGDSTPSNQLAAHTYGEMALQFQPILVNREDQNITSELGTYLSPVGYIQWYFDAEGYYKKIFQETSATDTTSAFFWSNRSIITRSTCMVHLVLDNVNGTQDTFKYQKDNRTISQTFNNLGPNSTTYMTRPESTECGPRCAQVFVYENNGTSAYYYECAVNVSLVQNATVREQEVSDENARLAAAAIALQGYQSTGNTNGSQFQQFPSESTYGTFTFGNETEIADYLRKYAIGVLVVADQILPSIDTYGDNTTEVQGWVPQQGLILNIDHVAYMWAIFGSIAGAHLVLWIIGAYIASRVAVIENSYLKIALALRPVTDELEEQGLLLGGHNHEHHALDGDVVYGPREEGEPEGVRALEISRLANCERVSKKWEGYYDS